jgi:hypothetical protein
MANVHDDDIADLVARQQVTPAEAPEGYREVGVSHTVYDSGKKIHAGGAVYRCNRHSQVQDPREQRGDCRARSSG